MKGSLIANEIMSEYFREQSWKRYIESQKNKKENEDKLKGGDSLYKVKAISNFTLKEFNKISNIERAGKEKAGEIFTGDIFECSEEMRDYLKGNNLYKKAFIEDLLKETEEKIIPKKRITPERTTTRIKKR